MLDAAAKPDSTEYLTMGLSGTAETQSSTLHTQRGVHFPIKPHPPTIEKPKNIRHSRPFVSGPSCTRMTHSRSKSLIQKIHSPTIISPLETERKSNDFFNTTWKLSNHRIWRPLDPDQKSPFQIEISNSSEMNLKKQAREKSTSYITYMNRRISHFPSNSPATDNRVLIRRSKASPFLPEKPAVASRKTSRDKYDKNPPDDSFETHSFKIARNKREVSRGDI